MFKAHSADIDKKCSVGHAGKINGRSYFEWSAAGSETSRSMLQMLRLVSDTAALRKIPNQGTTKSIAMMPE